MTKVKEMRLLRKISQHELASILHVKPPTVSITEKRGIYNTRIAAKYAKALKCNPIFLLEGLS